MMKQGKHVTSAVAGEVAVVLFILFIAHFYKEECVFK